MSKPLTAIGLMSGTSLDGIDVALLTTDGENLVRRGPAATYPYGEGERRLLRQALADALPMTERTQRPGCLAAAEEQLTGWHANAVEIFRAAHGVGKVDLIGFHGQTVLHRPDQHLTVQLGDGPLLARLSGTPVVYDLRAADVAAGGQGAPLVPVYHRALATGLAERPVAIVNIGGVANLTFIGRDGELIAFDTGPGNALINDWCERHLGEPMDRDGALAAQGVLYGPAFTALALHPFFEQPAPKSLDRNAFDIDFLEEVSPADGAMTLVHFTATSIARAPAWLPERPRIWVVTGGGRLNPTLMKVLRGLLEPLGDRLLLAEEAGFDGDAMEAEAWAYLAARSLRGLPITLPGTTKVARPMTGGVLAKP